MIEKVIVRSLILIVLFFAFESVSAKRKKKVSYVDCVLTGNSDSIYYGRVKFKTTKVKRALEISRNRYLFYDSNNKLMIVNPKNCSALVLKSEYGDFRYKSVSIEGKKIFLLEDAKGKIVLYKHSESSCRYALKLGQKAFCWGPLLEEYYLKVPDREGFMLINKKNYKKELNLLFVENEQLLQKIGKKNYRYKNMNRMITEFNQCE